MISQEICELLEINEIRVDNKYLSDDFTLDLKKFDNTLPGSSKLIINHIILISLKIIQNKQHYRKICRCFGELWRLFKIQKVIRSNAGGMSNNFDETKRIQIKAQ